jgi:CubicO group peptidase (beta-lactamase class C family)
MYREAEVSSQQPLAEFVDDLLEMPLAFQPGSAWRYSYSHDVAARLIEIMSGQALDTYLVGEVFEPLGMVDTGYHVPSPKLARFSAQYGAADLLQPHMTLTQWYGAAEAGANGLLSDPTTCLESTPHGVFRGGHGLVSTVSDYLRFCQMLLGEGELDGVRLLSRKTVEVITTNHLSPNLLPYEVGGTYSPGYGYGLGFRVLMDLGQCQTLGSVGEFGWVGAATTYFWVDPLEELIGILMSQFQPEGFHPITLDFRVMAYQAIMD